MLQKEIKDWTFEAYLLTEETSSIESLEMTCARSYGWFLNFFIKPSRLGLFIATYLAETQLNSYDLSKVRKRKQIVPILTCPKLAKCAYFILLLKSEKLVTERNERLNLWGLFIDWGNQFLIPTDWIIENDLCQILWVVLEFFIKPRGFGLFIAVCLAKTS